MLSRRTRLAYLAMFGSLLVIAFGVPPAAMAAPEIGVVSGSAHLQETQATQKLGAGLVRVEFPIETRARELGPVVAAHAANGTRVLLLAGFHSSMPSAAQARNLATWAKAYGPGGSFWEGRSGGRLAIREIEFGNETSYGWQYGDSWHLQSYRARARAYARRFSDAHDAIRAAGARVGLLAQADDAGTSSSRWVEGMFSAVPDLADRVAGWTVHPYGPRSKWQRRLQRLVEQTAAQGAPSRIPVYVTEWGVASDNGTCLSDNYGWSRCMTYAAAARALRDSVAGMHSQLGGRLEAIFIHQARDLRPTRTSRGREPFFGALRENFREKGVLTRTVRQLLASSPGSAARRDTTSGVSARTARRPDRAR